MAESAPRQARLAGAPDRMTVGLFSLAAFLVVLALLGTAAGRELPRGTARAPCSCARSTGPRSSNG